MSPFMALRPTAATQPDILLVILDDVSHVMLATAYRPNLIALAAQGFAFLNCSSMPLCSPSRRTILTAEYTVGGQTGVVCGPPDAWTIPHSTTLLPEFFPGYAAGMFGKWHAGSNPAGPWEETPQYQGFDVWRAGVPVNVTNCGGTDYWRWLKVEDGEAQQTLSEYQPTTARQDLLAWWEATSSPKIAVYAPQLAHEPLHRPPASLLPPGYPPAVGPAAKYEAMLVAADTLIGQVMAAVDLETTILIVVGDNGTPDIVSPTPGKAKGTTYQGGIHVPMLLAGPGIPHGQSSALVSIVDIIPTLLVSDTGDGFNLHPIMDGQASSVRTYLYSGQLQDAFWPLDECARSLRWKLRRTASGDQLFDLLTDPTESVNLIDDPAQVARIATMSAWLEANRP